MSLVLNLNLCSVSALLKGTSDESEPASKVRVSCWPNTVLLINHKVLMERAVPHFVPVSLLYAKPWSIELVKISDSSIGPKIKCKFRLIDFLVSFCGLKSGASFSFTKGMLPSVNIWSTKPFEQDNQCRFYREHFHRAPLWRLKSNENAIYVIVDNCIYICIDTPTVYICARFKELLLHEVLWMYYVYQCYCTRQL